MVVLLEIFCSKERVLFISIQSPSPPPPPLNVPVVLTPGSHVLIIDMLMKGEPIRRKFIILISLENTDSALAVSVVSKTNKRFNLF